MFWWSEWLHPGMCIFGRVAGCCKSAVMNIVETGWIRDWSVVGMNPKYPERYRTSCSICKNYQHRMMCCGWFQCSQTTRKCYRCDDPNRVSWGAGAEVIWVAWMIKDQGNNYVIISVMNRAIYHEIVQEMGLGTRYHHHPCPLLVNECSMTLNCMIGWHAMFSAHQHWMLLINN